MKIPGLTDRARREATERLKQVAPVLDKRAECDLHERGNSYNGRQARKSEQN